MIDVIYDKLKERIIVAALLFPFGILKNFSFAIRIKDKIIRYQTVAVVFFYKWKGNVIA